MFKITHRSDKGVDDIQLEQSLDYALAYAIRQLRAGERVISISDPAG